MGSVSAFFTRHDGIPRLSLVTHPAGTDLQVLKRFYGGRFHLAAVKRIVKQMLLALDFLHHNCRVIHGGQFIMNLSKIF